MFALATDAAPGRPNQDFALATTDIAVVVDWVPRRGVWPEGLLFVFDGGVLEEHRLADVRLPVDELAAARFVTLDEAREHLRPDMHRRLQVAREVAMSPDAPPAYLERGRRVLPPSRAIL